jgi:hypothetical protein
MQAQIRQHVDVRCAHAWKQEGESSFLAQRLLKEVDALAILNLLTLRVRQALERTLDLLPEVI